MPWRIEVMIPVRFLIVALFPFASLHAQTKLVEAGKFIHLRYMDKEGKERPEKEDTYLRAEAVESVVVLHIDHPADRAGPYTVRIVTRIQGEPGALSYLLGYNTRKEAEDAAKEILKAAAGEPPAKREGPRPQPTPVDSPPAEAVPAEAAPAGPKPVPIPKPKPVPLEEKGE